MSKIFGDIEYQFDLLSCMLTQLSDQDYRKRGEHISSIGGHVRHLIEYIQILINSDLTQPIDYAARKRNIIIESDRAYAIAVLAELKSNIIKVDRPVTILEDEEIVHSSYLREILYMHEHIVHHCAIMRVELDTLIDFELDACFGFAKATLKHLESHVSV